MKIKLAFLSLGILLGIVITMLIGWEEKTSSKDLLHMERNAMVEAVIDAIDTLQAGESLSAQLMLASAVNAEAQIIFKQKNSSAEDLKSARDWQSRMQKHNDRLKLRAAQEHPVQ